MEATSPTGNEAELVLKTKKKTATTSLFQREKTNYEQAASGVKHPGLCSSVKQMLLNIAA
jgi:hypothetical protein